MTRISLSQIFNGGLRGILNVQSQTMMTQNQIATGRRVMTPADDPIAAARILRVEQEQKGVIQFQKNIDAVENSLMLEETQLESVTNLLTRVRELTVQAGSGALSKNERTAIASELNSRVDELLALANTRNSSGEYVFGGHEGGAQPFTRTAGSPPTFPYSGDNGDRKVMISESTPIRMGDNGERIFTSVPAAAVPAAPVPADTDRYISTGHVQKRSVFETGFDAGRNYTVNVVANGDAFDYQVFEGPVQVASGTLGEEGEFEFSGVEFRIAGSMVGDYALGPFVSTTEDGESENILDSVAELAHELSLLGDTQPDKWQLEDIVATTLNRMDNAEAHIGAVRADVGARLNALDSTREMHSGMGLVNDKILSEIRDLDYAEAITRLTQENFVLQAAQQSFAQVSKLSLFNFLR